jgi:hypothetical protein
MTEFVEDIPLDFRQSVWRRSVYMMENLEEHPTVDRDRTRQNHELLCSIREAWLR